MDNFKLKIIGLFLLNVINLVISDQLETDSVSKEGDQIFINYDCEGNGDHIPRELHVEKYGDHIGIGVSLCEFLPRRQIGIYYKNNKLVVTQYKMRDEPTWINKKYKEHDLQKRVPDHTMIILNPSEINPSKALAIHHYDRYIYVYQGKQPESETTISADDSEEEEAKLFEPDWHRRVGSDWEICADKTDFKLYKFVQIYYRDDELFISQRDAPHISNSNNDTTAADLRYVGSDKTKIFLDPKKIDPKKEICIQHGNNSIYIYQDRKPDLSLRENKPDEIKYLPEDSNPDVRKENPRAENGNEVSAPDINSNNDKLPVPEITNIMPEPDEEGSKSVIDITFNSEETLNIGAFEFDKEKVFLILFKNNMMKVTQVDTPKECYLSEDNVDKLSIITSDENKLVVHPITLDPRAELKIRHENGKLYLWIGTYELPNVNTDQPNSVEAVERDSVIKDFDNIRTIDDNFESGKVYVLLPKVFNEFNLVSIAVDNSSDLKITQINTPQETLDRPDEYQNFKIETSDKNTLLLHPKKVHPYRYLHIKHDNGLIYVSCGNPEIPFVNTDVSGIIEIVESNSIVDTGRWWPDFTKTLPQPEITEAVPEYGGPEPDDKQPAHNNGPLIPESEQPVPKYTGPEPDSKPDRNNGSSIPESKQLVPEYTGSEPGYKPGRNNRSLIPKPKEPVPEYTGPEPDYKPDRNNGSSIPESKQPVPEHKQPEPDYTSSDLYDEKPKPDNKPNEPNDPTIEDFSKSSDDSLPVVLTPNMFNLNKLVVISHKKHKINIYQTDRDDNDDEDDDDDNSGYTDLHYSIPNTWKAVSFDPRKINPNKKIVIYYVNKTTYVSTAE
ncbi:uncharacterized protein LOC130673009 [Microplitis mediator]|uniref:uncharacterized protein LOC130673009 n=1 Tax=Microplitis mediator TaxID=375433 RepID=UPI0025570A04|nr:uncharacterized protein LOC130673009 [Microplitis mediator]